jgi:hypothetical protein
MALITPEVYGQLITEHIAGKVKILQLAKELQELDEFKEVGETVHFPVWKYSGDATTLASKGTITATELEQVESTATVTHIGKGIAVYDRSNLTALGDQLDEGAKQIGTAMARKLDADLLAEINENAVLKFPLNDTDFTEPKLIEALGLFGDEVDREDFAGIVVNSRLIPKFLSTSVFASFTSTTNTMHREDNGLATNGILGYWTGIPVYVSDKGTYDSGLSECITYVIKKDAIGYKKKRGMLIEESRVASQKKTDLFADMLYAVKLLDVSGIIVVRKTVA